MYYCEYKINNRLKIIYIIFMSKYCNQCWGKVNDL